MSQSGSSPSAPTRPKAFISHASTDKDRFVRGFATRLRERGVEAWFAEWEVQPGDSLIQRIFEGIGGCDVFIVVLSRDSLKSRWVREELNAGMVRKIEDGRRLIPIVLDDVAVPTVLRSTMFVHVRDLSDYAKELDDVLGAIFNVSPKPRLGPPPEYVKPSIKVPGL